MSQAKPQPVNILRGHRSQVHSTEFIRGNARLATGDADGYVVVWDLGTMRPTAVWRAHKNSILSIREWGDDKLITHGRDHHLIVWKLAWDDEDKLSRVPPIELSDADPPQPWIVHMLEVNTMNFCAFAACPSSSSALHHGCSLGDTSEILVAVPNTLASEAIDIFELPTQKRIYTIKPGDKNGMAMCLSLINKNGTLLLAAAFENGSLSVYQLSRQTNEWSSIYRCQAHSQPVLSIDIDPRCEYLLTSAADSIIAKHPLVPVSGQGATTTIMQDPIKSVNTKHSGQQGLTIRSDGKIFATAGWDANIRVYSAKTLNELAVLQWHQVGVYAVAFAKVEDEGQNINQHENETSCASTNASCTGAVERRNTTVAERRLNQAKMTHWVVAGAKDGKLSLWSIY